MIETAYKLAVCIPNYNRPEQLRKLLGLLAEQILADGLHQKVEICISDDHSPEAPDEAIREIKQQYPKINMEYHRNDVNKGMDYNFLKSVMIASGEYCWIVGNDDMPEEGALKMILRYIEDAKLDILVSPFDVYDENEVFMNRIDPLCVSGHEMRCFHTDDAAQYDDLIEKVQTGDALFCFLSNVVFKRARWIAHGSMFEDKMNTIFIQMYMNLQTLKEGAVYGYIPDKLIKNHADPGVNETYQREYDILIGLNGVIDYFFTGRQWDKLKKCIVDPRINGKMWSLPEDSVMKTSVAAIRSVKNGYYEKYFVRRKERKDRFKDRNIILYGAGNLGCQAAEELSDYDVESLSVYDADPAKWGKELAGYQIRNIEGIAEDYQRNQSIAVVANNLALVEIVEMLLQKGIDRIALIN